VRAKPALARKSVGNRRSATLQPRMVAVPGAGDGASLTSCPGAGVDRPATRALPFNVVPLGVRTIETPSVG